MDSYRMSNPQDVNALATCTGKPREVGGIAGREEASGLGVYYALNKYLNDKSFCDKAGLTPGLSGKTAIVMGLGAVGYNAALFAEDAGTKIVGVIEKNASLYNPNGMNIREVKTYLK